MSSETESATSIRKATAVTCIRTENSTPMHLADVGAVVVAVAADAVARVAITVVDEVAKVPPTLNNVPRRRTTITALTRWRTIV